MTAETVAAKIFHITLKRSKISCSRRQRETLRGLGLTYTGKTVLRRDSQSLQGMLRKVAHLIEVREYGS